MVEVLFDDALDDGTTVEVVGEYEPSEHLDAYVFCTVTGVPLPLTDSERYRLLKAVEDAGKAAFGGN